VAPKKTPKKKPVPKTATNYSVTTRSKLLRRFQRRAGGEPFFFRPGNRIDNIGARFR
jgi:hypothetical protein